jgi:protein-tyrosine phosphatase
MKWIETFNKILDFIEKWSKQRKILIHCDQGQSRAPTLGLLYLAKRLKSIPNDSFVSAKNEFMIIYPNYLSSGIGDYVAQNWNEIK